MWGWAGGAEIILGGCSNLIWNHHGTLITREQHSRSDLRYSTDLTDAEWAVLEPLLMAQRAILLLLEPIYEADFLPCSYGSQSGRSAHDALVLCARGSWSRGSAGWWASRYRDISTLSITGTCEAFSTYESRTASSGE